jgi:hypothetical protein
MMNSIIGLLLIILFGAVVLMAGILVCRESGKSIKSTLSECLAWGVGFFLLMSVQVAAIAAIS